MTNAFFSTLNYTSVNEDWRTEAAALRLGPSDRVLCVTGSGARPLDLLSSDVGEIVAIDVNAAQGHLLALKVAALAQLPFEVYAGFLGLTDGIPKARRAVFTRLDLPGATRLFWEARPGTIEAGVLYAGRWERFYRRVSWLARRLRPGAIDRLFAFDDLEAQRVFVESVWDSWAWRRVCDLVSSRLVSRLLLGDPAYAPAEGLRAGPYLFERMKRCLSRTLARESFMVGLVLQGALPERDLPPHLTRAGCDAIRPRLGRLTAVTDDVRAYLGGAGRFDAFSLSDVPSFLTAAELEGLLVLVVEHASPGARFAIRQFLTRYRVPARLEARLVRDQRLERRLEEEDRSFAYRFMLGEVCHA